MPHATIVSVQALLAPELSQQKADGDDGSDGASSSCGWKKKVPNPVRAHAFIAIGKLCLRDRCLTKDFVPLFARELQDPNTHISIRSNILILLGDLCMRFTTQLTQYIPNMAACLVDENMLLRRHALVLLTHLLKSEYIRFRPAIFYRIATMLADPEQELRQRANYVLSDVFLVKYPKLFLNNFLQTILVLVGYTDHPTIEDLGANIERLSPYAMGGSSVEQRRKRRRTVYRSLLACFSDEHKLEVVSKLCKDVLCELPNGLFDMRPVNPNRDEMIRDVFHVLSSDVIKVGSSIRGDALGRAAAAAIEESEKVAALEASKGKVLSKLSLQQVLQHVVPEMIRLKKAFESLRSPLLQNLMDYFTTLYGIKEVKDILARDFPMIKMEIEYDLKQHALARQAAKEDAAAQRDQRPRQTHRGTPNSMLPPPATPRGAASMLPPPPRSGHHLTPINSARRLSLGRGKSATPLSCGPTTLKDIVAQSPLSEPRLRKKRGRFGSSPASGKERVMRSAAKSWAARAALQETRNAANLENASLGTPAKGRDLPAKKLHLGDDNSIHMESPIPFPRRKSSRIQG